MTRAHQTRVEALHCAYWAWRGRALGACVRRGHGFVAICAPHIAESWYANRVLINSSVPAAALQDLILAARRSGCSLRLEAAERLVLRVDAIRDLGEPTAHSRIVCTPLSVDSAMTAVPGIRVVAVSGSEQCMSFWNAYRRFFEDDTLDSDTRTRLTRSLRHSRWIRAYTAHERDRVVGVGLLGLRHRIALLADAATAPSARRRGVYQALVAARIRDALSAGATIATSDLEPGSGSDRILLRLGLSEGYRRFVWTFAPPTDAAGGRRTARSPGRSACTNPARRPPHSPLQPPGDAP